MRASHVLVGLLVATVGIAVMSRSRHAVG